MNVLDNPVVVTAVVVAAVGYVILRRSVGEPLSARDLAAPPLILLFLGLREVLRGDPLTTMQTVALVGVGVVAVALGAARAVTVRLYLRDGVLWYRYRPATYLAWVITALVGAGVRLGTYAVADLPESARSLYLAVGLTLAGESLVLAGRGLLSGERFSSDGRDSEAARRVIHEEMRGKLRRR